MHLTLQNSVADITVTTYMSPTCLLIRVTSTRIAESKYISILSMLHTLCIVSLPILKCKIEPIESIHPLSFYIRSW